MKVIIYLQAVLSISLALPSPKLPWNEIQGRNISVEPVSNHPTVKNNGVNGRIIGGDEVEPHSRPYQAGLIINGQNFCSGSLISPNYVLTAAHCIFSASYVEIILGAHNVNIQEASQLRVTSSNIIIHEGYMIPDRHSNDISLIKTPEHIVTNNYIQIVRLPQADAGAYENFVGALSGWGTTSLSSSTISHVLLETYLSIIPNTLCSYYSEPDAITSSIMCSWGNSNNPSGPCNGDSGAPLVVGNVQVGLLSFLTSQGCESNYPSGYTRISYYRTWINQNTDLRIVFLSSSTFAIRNNGINGRIVGGDEVEPHSRPYQAALIINGESLCSGSLISPNYVLTAAQCTVSASYVEIILGAHNINIQEPSQIRVTSNNIIIHEDYMKPDNHSNDISVIKTPSHIVTNNYIQIVRLAQQDDGSYGGYVGALSGWGTTSLSNSTISEVLLEAYILIISNSLCSDYYEPGTITSSIMCSWGNWNNPSGPCNGDSGAPLVVDNVQVGLLSFLTSKGCKSNYPNGYTRISYYRTWINQNTDLASYVEIILGAHNINIQEPSQIRVTSNNIIIHEDYMKPDNHSNDISVIKTPSHIVTNNYIQIVRLAQQDDGSYEGYVGALSGWGRASDSNLAMSPILLEIYLLILDNSDCSQFLEPSLITPRTMCSYKAYQVSGPCTGDFGAPLLVGRTQVGLASFTPASDGCEFSYLSGYSRISYYRPWINHNTDL
ncbi:hypothetical protein NQ315_011566 [Exocentrus adspersus]|uniref:Peptidase S1 domain-containing protein n=1 Tax=Exocentrus adspersus TaxID=1586481 RepID=A0AAV8VV93_9CUCU|nr:hypothetical protein NQ315_011566 [Exocentrus adspersus]